MHIFLETYDVRRKSKCYTKNLEMLKYSVLPLMKYRNKEIGMFN